MSDARGIRSAQLSVGGATRELLAGTRHPAYARGFHALLLPAEWQDAQHALSPLALRLAIDLVGTSDLAFVPAASATEVTLRSDWPHPSFRGRFLPAERSIDARGFSATWRVSGLASDAAQGLGGSAAICGAAAVQAPAATACLDTLAVAFIDPINIYVLSDRAIKYGLLFIVLTLGAVALMEVLARRPVHPIQYLLVGAALTIFFLLLLSLSEHLPFAQAYALAAGACVALLGFYAAHMLGQWRRGLAFGGAIAVLYGAMYTLLQLEQSALVVGALLLFALLALTMIATRRVDWYALLARVPGRPAML
jgi:inner membrane protein